MLWHGNACGKYQGNIISRSLSPALIIIVQKQKNVKHFKYLGSMVTKDAKSTREIKSWIGMEKAAFNK
jgi:hypothetical protein